MDNDYPDWFLWAYSKGFVFWLCVCAVLGTILLAVVLHLDDSLRDAENRLHKDLTEIQDVEGRQSDELKQIREELDNIQKQLDELRKE